MVGRGRKVSGITVFWKGEGGAEHGVEIEEDANNLLKKESTEKYRRTRCVVARRATTQRPAQARPHILPLTVRVKDRNPGLATQGLSRGTQPERRRAQQSVGVAREGAEREVLEGQWLSVCRVVWGGVGSLGGKPGTDASHDTRFRSARRRRSEGQRETFTECLRAQGREWCPPYVRQHGYVKIVMALGSKSRGGQGTRERVQGPKTTQQTKDDDVLQPRHLHCTGVGLRSGETLLAAGNKHQRKYHASEGTETQKNKPELPRRGALVGGGGDVGYSARMTCR